MRYVTWRGRKWWKDTAHTHCGVQQSRPIESATKCGRAEHLLTNLLATLTILPRYADPGEIARCEERVLDRDALRLAFL